MAGKTLRGSRKQGIEQRELISSEVLAGDSTWPGLQQVFQVARETTEKKSGKVRAEIVYGVTSLPMERASAACLWGLVRGHGAIENVRLECAR